MTKTAHTHEARMATQAPGTTTSRRRLLGGAGAILALALIGGPALLLSQEPAKAQEAAQRIADHFSSVKSMTGDFVQFGPQGEQTGGKFFLDRPGKLRFNYDAPSPVRLISDGESVVIGNEKLGTWDVYPLSKTPLALLLADRIDISGANVRSVTEEPDLTTIVLGDSSVFGDSTITMMFDPQTYELKQWTILDAQGKETTVMIMNVQTGVEFAANVFAVPYDQLRGGTMRN